MENENIKRVIEFKRRVSKKRHLRQCKQCDEVFIGKFKYGKQCENCAKINYTDANTRRIQTYAEKKRLKKK